MSRAISTTLFNGPVCTFLFALATIGSINPTAAGNVTDQWQPEDHFCHELELQTPQVCICQVGYENLLSIVCNATGLKMDAFQSLKASFDLLNQYEAKQEMLIDAIELIDFGNSYQSSLNAAIFPNVQVNTLRILDSPRLKLFNNIDHLPEKFRSSVRTLHISNISVGQEVLTFISHFGNLHAALLSALPLEPVLRTQAFKNGTFCYRSLRRLSLNFDCHPLPAPITSIQPGIFSNLCALSILDLSCLGLTTISPGVLRFNARPNGLKGPSKLSIDLSRNQLTSMKNALADVAAAVGTSFQLHSFHINLNHNPLATIPQDILQYHSPSNDVQLWQNQGESNLDCASCDHAWLVSLANSNIDSYCAIKNVKTPSTTNTTPLRISQLTTAHYSHCRAASSAKP